MKEPVTLVRSIRQRLLAHFEKAHRLPRKTLQRKLRLRTAGSCSMHRSQDVSAH